MLTRFLRQHTFTNHLLVILQFSGITLSCYPVGLQNLGSKYSLLLCAIGATLGIVTLCYNKIGNFSVYPEIKQHAKLVTTGPYQYIRHPMYVALIIMMIGIALYNYHWMNSVGSLMVVGAVINKANVEERLLLIRFPNYSSYQHNTKQFIPFIY